MNEKILITVYLLQLLSSKHLIVSPIISLLWHSVYTIMNLLTKALLITAICVVLGTKVKTEEKIDSRESVLLSMIIRALLEEKLEKVRNMIFTSHVSCKIII